jgi:hypothetical protein
MYAAIISAEPPTANFNRRMGKVFVNRVIERSTSKAPLKSGSSLSLPSNHSPSFERRK